MWHWTLVEMKWIDKISTQMESLRNQGEEDKKDGKSMKEAGSKTRRRSEQETKPVSE